MAAILFGQKMTPGKGPGTEVVPYTKTVDFCSLQLPQNAQEMPYVRALTNVWMLQKSAYPGLTF